MDFHTRPRPPRNAGLALKHHATTLHADPSRTVIRPFLPEDPTAFAVEGHPRVERIARRVLDLDQETMEIALGVALESLKSRHRDVEELLARRFDDIAHCLPDAKGIDDGRRLLIGAYFSEEYSFESAALFNPSAVLAADQSGVPDGAIRIVLSLRGIGEGHVSSVTFRTGIWSADGEVEIDKPGPIAVAPIIERDGIADSDGGAKLHCGGSESVSETVLFPVLPSQARGIEDLRLVRFVEEDGTATYHGTYTAFDGRDARSELLSGDDFKSFLMRPMRGAAAEAKGMALFPRRIDGRYTMLARQDSESVWLLSSDDLLSWDDGAKLISPWRPWEYVQMGNCGSPIEIEEGWLVLTHGVGIVRNYCIGACLLDREDPGKVLARTRRPILEPSPEERDGYVPNVVYSCGGLVHDRTLLLPYGVADSFTAFASVGLDALLKVME